MKGAHYEGVAVPASAGGRSLWIPVPAGWEDLGYPERTNGKRNFFEVVGNTPGLRDAGREFAKIYDAFLFEHGFQQPIVERRLFYRHSPTGLAIICVYVDDNWTYLDDVDESEIFYKLWSKRFNESKNVASAGNDFRGVSTTTRVVPFISRVKSCSWRSAICLYPSQLRLRVHHQ